MRGLDRRYSPKRKMAQKVLTRGSACNIFEIGVLTTQGLGGRQGVTEYGTPEERTGRTCPGGGGVTQPRSCCRAESIQAAPSPVQSQRRRSQQLGHPCKHKTGTWTTQAMQCTMAVIGPGVPTQVQICSSGLRKAVTLHNCPIPEVATISTKEYMLTYAGAWL